MNIRKYDIRSIITLIKKQRIKTCTSNVQTEIELNGIEDKFTKLEELEKKIPEFNISLGTFKQ